MFPHVDQGVLHILQFDFPSIPGLFHFLDQVTILVDRIPIQINNLISEDVPVLILDRLSVDVQAWHGCPSEKDIRVHTSLFAQPAQDLRLLHDFAAPLGFECGCFLVYQVLIPRICPFFPTPFFGCFSPGARRVS